MFVRSFFLSLATFIAGNAAAEEPPLFSSYPGSVFMTKKVNEFMGFNFPLSVAADDQSFADEQRVEGRLSQYAYEIASGASALQVYRNYQQALKKAQAEILFACLDQECIGNDNIPFMYVMGQRNHLAVSHEDQSFGYITAKLNREGESFYVGLIAGQFKDYTRYEVIVLKQADMATDLVTVDEIKESLFKQGKIALYGIYFDTGKATIKPESEPTLANMKSFLNQHPKVSVYLVGHTDYLGAHSYNQKLSKRRADAVVKALVNRGIAASRLQSEGVGPLAPVATNENEKGRKKNRRVELVLKQSS